MAKQTVRKRAAVPDDPPDVHEPIRPSGRQRPKTSVPRTKQSAGRNTKVAGVPIDMYVVDPVFAAAADTVAKDLGHDEYLVADVLERISCGIPLPCLALAYLFGMDIWPFSRITELYGREGSCKTAFAFDVMRWKAIYAASGAYIENENKEAGILMNSIMRQWAKAIRYAPSNTMQDWQRILTGLTAALDAAIKSNGKGFLRPAVFTVDSILGTGSEGALQKILDDGAAGRTHPEEALVLKYYSGLFVSMFRGRPWSMLFTNHYKAPKDQQGITDTTKTPGGKAIDFMATLRIKMAPVKTLKTTQYGGKRIQFAMKKNSGAPGDRVIDADILWRQEPIPGDPKNHHQVTYWDWDAATIDMLIRVLADKNTAKTTKDAIRDVVDLHISGGRRVWSKVLGIEQKDAERFSIAGQMLEARPDLVEQLYPLLMISRHKIYEPGVSYAKQLKAAVNVNHPWVERRYSPIPHDAFVDVSDALEGSDAPPEEPDGE